MADVTENLALTLPDPSTDGDEPFNLETMLNWNMIKIDAAFGNLDEPALELGLESTDVAGILLALARLIHNGGQLLPQLLALHVWRKYTLEAGVLTEVAEVTDTDPEAHPRTVGGEADGYYWSYEGTVGRRIRMETGIYTGDGTYGEGHGKVFPYRRPPAAILIQTDWSVTGLWLIPYRSTPNSGNGRTYDWGPFGLTVTADTAAKQWSESGHSYIYAVIYN